MLALPDGVTTCLSDLDGGLSGTASVHPAASKAAADALGAAIDVTDRDDLLRDVDAEHGAA